MSSKAVLVIGKSGAGKSTSGKNLPPKETFWIKCTNKELPFKGGEGNYKEMTKDNPTGNCLVTSDSDRIIKALKHVSTNMPEIKNIILDDYQYIMGFEFMGRVKDKGFDKFNDIAVHAFNIINTIKNELRDDLFIAVLTHSEENVVAGEEKVSLKTIGKMLNEKITLEGMFTVVLHAKKKMNETTNKLEGYFITNGDDNSIVKSPSEMFEELEIPNDLALVKEKMIEYYS